MENPEMTNDEKTHLIATNSNEAYYKFITTHELHDMYKYQLNIITLPKCPTVKDFQNQTKIALLNMLIKGLLD